MGYKGPDTVYELGLYGNVFILYDVEISSLRLRSKAWKEFRNGIIYVQILQSGYLRLIAQCQSYLHLKLLKIVTSY